MARMALQQACARRLVLVPGDARMPPVTVVGSVHQTCRCYGVPCTFWVAWCSLGAWCPVPAKPTTVSLHVLLYASCFIWHACNAIICSRVYRWVGVLDEKVSRAEKRRLRLSCLFRQDVEHRLRTELLQKHNAWLAAQQSQVGPSCLNCVRNALAGAVAAVVVVTGRGFARA